ncbi:MAG: hypothetical protein P3W91_000695 [Fervidobacterium sp.]|nr:hypothetical protein [Fervidobacterium sp.]
MRAFIKSFTMGLRIRVYNVARRIRKTCIAGEKIMRSRTATAERITATIR